MQESDYDEPDGVSAGILLANIVAAAPLTALRIDSGASELLPPVSSVSIEWRMSVVISQLIGLPLRITSTRRSDCLQANTSPAQR